MDSALDASRLSSFIDDVGDITFVMEAIRIFLIQLPSRERQLEVALGSGDIETARGAAHTLGSTSALFGLVRLERFCRALESSAGGFSAREVRELISALSAASKEASDGLAHWLADQGSKR